MSELRIITNNQPRDLLMWHELTDAERKELDYITNPEDRGTDFFRYKGWIYDVGEFELPGDHFPGWDGYHGDSFFSGILIRYPREEWGALDTEHIIVGWYCC